MLPYNPVTGEDTDPAAEAWTPASTPITVLVSPASGSVSFVSTLPLGLVPAVPLLTPPASTAVALSETAIGASLTAVMLTVTLPVAVSAPPLPCAPLLPSLKVQSIWTLAGGALVILAVLGRSLLEFRSGHAASGP